MAMVNVKGSSSGQTGEMELLPTDVYFMVVKRALIEDDQYGEIRKDGSQPQKLVITWEVSRVTPEQEDSDVGKAVWQRLTPYYGVKRDGSDSNFKEFVDRLRKQGNLEDFDPDVCDFDPDWLEGIEQRVAVEHYTKSMGPNAGKPGNKITSVMPLSYKKAAPAATARPEPIAPKRAARPAHMVVPVGNDDEGSIPF